MPEPAANAPAMDGVVLRPMTSADLPHAHALSAELRWPHRLADWEQVFAHAEGTVVERDGEIIATALRWRWGERHATIGLVIVTPACQGRRIGHRLMTELLEGMLQLAEQIGGGAGPDPVELGQRVAGLLHRVRRVVHRIAVAGEQNRRLVIEQQDE